MQVLVCNAYHCINLPLTAKQIAGPLLCLARQAAQGGKRACGSQPAAGRGGHCAQTGCKVRFRS